MEWLGPRLTRDHKPDAEQPPASGNDEHGLPNCNANACRRATEARSGHVRALECSRQVGSRDCASAQGARLLERERQLTGDPDGHRLPVFRPGLELPLLESGDGLLVEVGLSADVECLG